jgi:GTP-binding protein Era
LALNKIDTLPDDGIFAAAQPFLDLLPVSFWLPISATRGENLLALLERIVHSLPLGPRYFPADQVTDQQVRFIAAELVREAALNILRQEVPHTLAVVVTEFKPRHENLTFVSANIILERKSHKQIVIGEQGQTLRKIGQMARTQIAEMLGTKVYLELWVKVRPKWRTNENELKWLGYSTQ